jgi:tellurite methyltransferase
MISQDLQALIGATDIYLLDQILKGRYQLGYRLLDAGCGGGRNLHWFLRNGFEIYGVDRDPLAIAALQEQHPDLPAGRFLACDAATLPFPDGHFEGIISSAVLHFAESTRHFFQLVDELHRVLKGGGSLFIRMTSDIGIEDKVVPTGEGVFLLPDGSTRFLLTRALLEELLRRYDFRFLEEFKTVNVGDKRCMSTLVLQKSGR